MPGETDVRNRRIDIYFDENVQLKDVTSKVVVSPAQKEMPQITSNGRRVTVELRDTLIDSTTYTIDFGDAISDLNEGNIYDGFAMEFSTGKTIDSLRISGMLFEARTLEPAQGMLVGVYSNLDDSCISTLPMERIARTNQYGQFTIRGLKEGNYRIFAVNDLNRDYHWDRSEDVAFYDVTVSPSVNAITVTDTLLDSHGQDSLVTRPGVEYLPNDILLTWFNQNYKAQYLQKYERIDSTRFYIEMAAPSDTLPELTIVNGKNAGRKIDRSNSRLNASATLDTLEFWITDPEIISQDSLSLATRYLKTDSNDQLSWTTDTLKFNFRRPKVKEKKKKKKDEEGADSVPQLTFVDFRLNSGNQDVNRPMRFSSATPLDTIIQSMIHLEVKEDSLWIPVTMNPIVTDTLLRPMRFHSDVRWTPGSQYRLTIDSLAIIDIYGHHNKPITQEFKVKALEDYSALFFNMADTTASVIVELLDSHDEPVAVSPVIKGTASFNFITPGTYYARAFIDANGNGVWDTGSVQDKIQPEEVYYYPKKLNLRKNWDVEETWNIYELPVDLQKPLDIKKNKPKNSSKEKTADEEEDEEDDWSDTNFIPGSQYNDVHRNRDNNRYR